jgi:Domain of unknown function (DUF1996)/F5/8 type C domain
MKLYNNLALYKFAWLIAGVGMILSACTSEPHTHEMGDMPGMTPITTQATDTCKTLNIAQGKVASASASQNNNLNAAAAVDGDPTTRWSSPFSDPQWLQVNLGNVQQICGVTLQWEGAYAKSFKLEVSNDAQTWTSIYATTTSTGGTQALTISGSGQYLRMTGTVRGTPYGYSMFEFQVFSPTAPVTPGSTGYVMANPTLTGVVPSSATPPHRYFHEFQANCAVSRSNLSDDPIVSFGKPGVSHSHTFLGNVTTNAFTTLSSLQAGATSCSAPGDKSGYWMPSMFNGTVPVQPEGKQVIYYKTGVDDYTSVRPFPLGLRFLVGNMNATPEEFLAGSYEGWECGNSYHNADFPTSCLAGTQLNIRYQAPSCWNGLHLDTPDHRSHMAYPVNGRCTASHPIAVPMLEFKMAFPAGSDTSKLRLASGRGYSFHYDFFNAWDAPTLKALIDKCIVRGFQCDARGYDEAYPNAGAVLGLDYRLP